MNKISAGLTHRIGDRLIDEMKSGAKRSNKSEEQPSDSGGMSFMDHLAQNIKDVNEAQKISEKMGTDLISGKSENIHETMLATTKADLSFKMMVQVRNKVLEAYNEVMRMPV